MKHLAHLLGASFLLLTSGSGELHQPQDIVMDCMCVSGPDVASLNAIPDAAPSMSGVTIVSHDSPASPDEPEEPAWCEGSDDPRCSSLPAPRDTTHTFASPLGAVAHYALRSPTDEQMRTPHHECWLPEGFHDRIERPPQA